MSLGVFNSAAFLTDAQLAVATNATIEVRRESDSGLAAIFSDRAGTAGITNPSAFADAAGRFAFYTAASPGGFSVEVTSGAESFTLRNVPVGLASEFDIDEFWRSVLAAATRLAARLGIRAMGFDGVTSRATNTILAAADAGEAFVATGDFTQTLTAAATLGDGWHVHYRVNSGQTVTIDPDGAELIDGAATKVVVGPAAGTILCDGAAFYTTGFDQPAAADAVAGIIELATQAEQETGADVLRAVTPGRQHFHPSAAKAWTKFSTSAGTVADILSHNVTSITDGGVGIYTVNFSTSFSSANYAALTTVQGSGANPRRALAVVPNGTPPTAGGCTIHTSDSNAGTAVDYESVFAAFFGDQ